MRDWLQQRSAWQLATLAAVGSVLHGVGSPPSSVGWLAWLGFVPMLLAAEGLRGRAGKTAMWVGWFGGLGVGLFGFPWIASTLQRFAGFDLWLAGLGLLLFSAWTALPYGLWMLAIVQGPAAGPWRLAWTIASWVGITTVWPSLFPYTPIIGLAQLPEWIQAAELGGVAAVEALVIAASYACARACMEQGRARAAAGLVAVAIPALAWLAGAWRLQQLDAAAEDAPELTVGVVQPNTALMTSTRRDKMERLWRQSARAEQAGAELMVWPEAGIYPWPVTRPWTHDFTGPRQVLRWHRTPTILGVSTEAKHSRYGWNSAVLMDEHGEVAGMFDKTRLVPFGERVPLVDPDWARQYVPTMSHNNPGFTPARFEFRAPAGTFGAGPLICYEDIFWDFSRAVARQPGGIHLFVNVTIDTWFGDTAEPWEHLALAQFRSVEHRIPMVRSVAAGVSSVVDHGGRVQAQLAVTDPAKGRVPAQHLVSTVKLPRDTASAPTVFARFGWMLAWLCVLATVAGSLAGYVRSKYRAPRRA